MNMKNTYYAVFNHSNDEIKVSFLDFPDLYNSAKTDEEAMKVAKKILTEKLETLKKESVEFPTPKKIGEFTTTNEEVVMPITANLGMAMLKDGMENMSSSKLLENDKLNSSLIKVADIFGNPINSLIEKTKLTNIKQFSGIVGAVLYILASFMGLISVNPGFFRFKGNLFTPVMLAGNFGVSPGFWGYLAFLLGLLIVASGALSGYSSYIKNIKLFKLSILANILFFIITVIAAIIVLIKMKSGFLSWGVIMYIIAIIVLLASYSILSKENK